MQESSCLGVCSEVREGGGGVAGTRPAPEDQSKGGVLKMSKLTAEGKTRSRGCSLLGKERRVVEAKRMETAVGLEGTGRRGSQTCSPADVLIEKSGVEFRTPCQNA